MFLWSAPEFCSNMASTKGVMVNLLHPYSHESATNELLPAHAEHNHWSNPERQDMSFTLFVLRVLPVYCYCTVSIAMLSFNSSTDLSTLHWDFSIVNVWIWGSIICLQHGGSLGHPLPPISQEIPGNCFLLMLCEKDKLLHLLLSTVMSFWCKICRSKSRSEPRLLQQFALFSQLWWFNHDKTWMLQFHQFPYTCFL